MAKYHQANQREGLFSRDKNDLRELPGVNVPLNLVSGFAPRKVQLKSGL
jgi:hypothetical protein